MAKDILLLFYLDAFLFYHYVSLDFVSSSLQSPDSYQRSFIFDSDTVVVFLLKNHLRKESLTQFGFD